MQLITKFNKRFRFLLCVINIFSKYAQVTTLKDEKGISIVDTFQKILHKSEHKPNKIWVEKGFRNTKILLLKDTHQTGLNVINGLKGEDVIVTLYEKELEKTNQQEFRIEKLTKRKGDKLYVKWKGYGNSFNSWIDKNALFYCIKNESIFSKTV